MKKILIIKNDGIGDAIISAPFFNFFINQTNSEVDILCQKKSYTYLKSNFKFKNIITVNKDIYFTFPTIHNLSIKNKFINIYKYLFFRPTLKDKKIKKDINNNNYDFVIVLRRYIRQSTFYFMNNLNAKNKLCMWQYPTNLSITKALNLTLGWDRITLDKEIYHEFDYYQSVLKQIYKHQFSKLSLKPNLKDKTNKKNTNRIAFVLGNVKRGINLELIKSICLYLRKMNYEINIFGGNDTKNFLLKHKLIAYYDYSYAGELSLNSGKELIQKNCDFIIGNDTGFMHYLSDTLIPMFIFASGETPRRFFPWPQHIEHFVVHKTCQFFSCGTCLLSRRECMDYDFIDIKKLIESFLNKSLKKNVIYINDEPKSISHFRWG